MLVHMKHPDDLSEIEMAILEHLQRDARISSADLATQLNSSITSVWRRIKKLEESGLIRGYHAQIDARRLGFGIESFLSVSVHSHDERSIQLFEAAVTADYDAQTAVERELVIAAKPETVWELLVDPKKASARKTRVAS